MKRCPHRWRSAVLARVLVGSWLLGSSLAFAAEPRRLTWNAPDGCPTRTSVLARLPHAPSGPPGRPDGLATGVEADARVVQAGPEQWRATVDIVADGARTERTLEATTCDAIADAVVLIVGIADVFPPSADDRSKAPPDTARSPPDRIGPAEAKNRPRSWRGPQGVSVRAGAVVDAGTLPALAPGGSFGLTWRVRPVAFDVEVASFVAQGTSPAGTAAAPGEGATVGLAYALVSACLSLPVTDRVVMDTCAGLAFERMTSEGFGPRGAFQPTTPSPAVGETSAVGELGVEWWPTPRFAIRAAARGLAPLGRRTFFVQGAGEVFRTHAGLEPHLALVVSLTQ